MANTAVLDSVCVGLRQAGMDSRTEKRIEARLRVWINSCGSDWTLARVKALHEYIVQTRAGLHPDVPEGFRRNSKKELAGDFKSLVTHPNFDYVNRVFGAITSSFIEEKVTDKQWSKWTSGLETEVTPVDPELVQGLKSALKRRYSPQLVFDLEEGMSEELYQAPGLNILSATAIPVGTESIKLSPVDKDMATDSARKKVLAAYIQTWSNVPNSTLDYLGFLEEKYDIWGASSHFWYHNRYYGIDREDQLMVELLHSQEDAYQKGLSRPFNSDIVGTIGFLQQEKNKLRAVANPNRVSQFLTEPFGELLQSMTDHHPGSFVKDQEMGHAFIQQCLKDGLYVYSMDLSAATDSLSFETMRQALEGFFEDQHKAYKADQQRQLARQNAPQVVRDGLAKDDSQLESLIRALDHFDSLSAGLWYAPELENRTEQSERFVAFVQGQPLGLRPSFPFLTMQNLATADLAIAQAYKHSKNPLVKGTRFACVGDDMAIAVHPSLVGKEEGNPAWHYAKLISDQGSLLNLDKTIQSFSLAEFCGKLISRNRMWQKSPKWKLPTDGNVISIMSTFPTFKYDIMPIQRKALNAVRNVPSSYGGIYGKYKPRTDIKFSDAAYAYEFTKMTFDNDLFTGMEDEPAYRLLSNDLLWYKYQQGVEPLSLSEARDIHLPLSFRDIVSQNPTSDEFDYLLQERVPIIRDTKRMLSSLIKAGRRRDAVLKDNAFSYEDTFQVQRTRSAEPGVVYEFTLHGTEVYVAALRPEGQGRWFSDTIDLQEMTFLQTYRKDILASLISERNHRLLSAQKGRKELSHGNRTSNTDEYPRRKELSESYDR